MAEGGEAFEGGDEEGAGAAGRVEDAEVAGAGEDACGVGGLERGVCECGVREVVGDVECVQERVIDEGRDEGARGVERAGAASHAGVHERFEGPAEQVRVDGGFRPGAGVFAGGEAEAGQGVEQEWGELFVVQGRVTGAAFGGGGGEESAVEERDVAEGAGRWRAVSVRGVEGAEREWGDEAWPEVAAVVEGVFGVSGEEGAIVVQPALGLEELEEEQSGDVDEGEGASVLVGDAGGERRGDVGDVGVEGTEEAASDGVSAEQFVPAEAGE